MTLYPSLAVLYIFLHHQKLFIIVTFSDNIIDCPITWMCHNLLSQCPNVGQLQFFNITYK